MLFSLRNTIGAVAALVLFVGCDGPANEYEAIVTGTVTVDGELANSGIVTFHPVDDGKVAIGRIHPNGSFSLRTGQGDLTDADGGTVVPGEYIVTVSITGPEGLAPGAVEGSPPRPGPSLVAAKYATKETSDLQQTVVAGKQVIVLELEPAEDTSTVETAEEVDNDDAKFEDSTDQGAGATSAEESKDSLPAESAETESAEPALSTEQPGESTNP